MHIIPSTAASLTGSLLPAGLAAEAVSTYTISDFPLAREVAQLHLEVYLVLRNRNSTKTCGLRVSSLLLSAAGFALGSSPV